MVLEVSYASHSPPLEMTPYTYTIGHRFAKVAAVYGDRPALAFSDGTTFTYRALDELAARMATLLRSRGVGRGDVVAFFTAKSPLPYITMLACLRLGAPYVNLDHTSPPERLARILERCCPAALLTDSDLPPELAPALKGAVVLGPGLDPTMLPLDNDEVAVELTGTSPAYLMFTSGSTGFPKGAVISHAAVLNFADWAAKEFALIPDDRLTNVNPLYFDNSVFDFYSSLLNGACLYPFTRDETRDARSLVRAVEAAGCTIWFSVPSMLMYLTTMRAIPVGGLPTLRAVVFGGEGYPKPELRKLHSLIGNHTRLVNVYGPTECTCICSAYTVSEADFADIDSLAPLGRVADNFDYLILDDNNLPVALEETGELCLLGPQVGLGYWRDPERSAAAFVQNPLNDRHAERMYRTGDLVNLGQDGLLRFRGRKDNQIKHMGYRIELEEIDAALYAIPGVIEAAAGYWRERAAYGHLVAAVSAERPLDDATLREALQQRLPPYMLPDSFQILKRLPKNQNGKISRQAVIDLFANPEKAR